MIVLYYQLLSPLKLAFLIMGVIGFIYSLLQHLLIIYTLLVTFHILNKVNEVFPLLNLIF